MGYNWLQVLDELGILQKGADGSVDPHTFGKGWVILEAHREGAPSGLR